MEENLSLKAIQAEKDNKDKFALEIYEQVKALYPEITDKQLIARLFVKLREAYVEIADYRERANQQSWKDYARQQERSGGIM